MNRYLLVATVLLCATPSFGQEGRIRIGSSGTADGPVQANPGPGIVLRILKVVNGTVPGYDLNGNIVPGTSIKYVFVDSYGRQKGAIGEGAADPDNAVSIAYYDGYIDAARVGRFAIAKTAKTPDGSVNAYKPGTQTPIFSLKAETKPSQG